MSLKIRISELYEISIIQISNSFESHWWNEINQSKRD